MKSGIYKIQNITSGSFYIGSACNLNGRKSQHFSELRSNKHENNRLQKAFNKYGNDAFFFMVLEYCNKDQLIEREQHYMDTLNPNYNIAKTAGSNIGNTNRRGKKHKIESILMQSGENSPHCKISSKHVKEIRDKYKPKIYSSYRLAKEYGCSRQQINRIVNKTDRKYE